MPDLVRDVLTGCLEVPLGACLTDQDGEGDDREPVGRRLLKDLEWAAAACNRARNACARAWLRWREDHLDWTPPPARDGEGNPRLCADGETPVPLSPMHPLFVDPQGNPHEPPYGLDADAKKAWLSERNAVGFDTYLYHAARRVEPRLATLVCSSSRLQVLENLKSRRAAPYRRPGGPRHRWEAVLACEDQLPTWNREDIPVPNCGSALAHEGRATRGLSRLARAARERTLAASASGYILVFPVFSSDSGRSRMAQTVRLVTHGLAAGDRRLLGRVCKGEWKFQDSRIVRKRGKWFFQLSYKQPTHHLGLDPDRKAALWPCPVTAPRPFRLELDAETFWWCGEGRWLAAEYGRLESRRRAIRGRYRVQTSSVRGHGRGRFEARLAPWARKTQDFQDHFCWQLVNEAVRFCRRNNCGTVLYREPVVAVRDRLWLARKGVPYDWTRQLNRLQFKLASLGIALEVEQADYAMLRNRFGDEFPFDPGGNGGGPLVGSNRGVGQGVARRSRTRGRFQGVAIPEPLADSDSSSESASG